MQIAIRTDSSVQIGTGHMMRCLTLAESLRAAGNEIVFICRNLPGNVAGLAKQRGFPVFLLEIADTNPPFFSDAIVTKQVLNSMPVPVDWLIADHYRLDACWESTIRPCVGKVMVIDDLANRRHTCDLLLDANYGQALDRYSNLTSSATKLLLGPEYALLREEFSLVAGRIRTAEDVRRVQIFFGGSDSTNETGKILKALAGWEDRRFSVEVIVGAANPNKEEIRRLCLSLPEVEFFCQVSNMAERMNLADLAIGAGGTALWERCYLGLPSIVISVADNQVEASRALERAGAICYLGKHSEVDCRMIRASIKQFIAVPRLLAEMSHKARVIVPHNGTEKVVDILMQMGCAGKQGNILVSSAARKIPLLQAVRQAMDKLGGNGKVIAADCDAKCSAKYFADDFWQMPLLSAITNQKLLAGLQCRDVRYIIPTRDGELLFWSERKAWLHSHGIAVMAAGVEPTAGSLDKLAFYEHCRALDIPAIETRLKPDGLNADWYVVKERYGAGSRQLGLKLSQREAEVWARKMEQPVFQPFVSGKEYSVDAYVDQSGRVKGAVCRTRDVVVNGESQITTTVNDVVLEKKCTEYIEQLGLYGHVVLQVLVDETGKITVIECNARFGGASTLSIAAGLDSLYWFLLESRGEDLRQYPFKRREKELRQVRYPQDLVMEVTE